MRWSIRGTKYCDKVSNQSVSISNRLRQFNLTFGFVRRSEGVVRLVVNMEYVASEELGNLVRLGIVLEVHFTYAIQFSII